MGDSIIWQSRTLARTEELDQKLYPVLWRRALLSCMVMQFPDNTLKFKFVKIYCYLKTAIYEVYNKCL